MKLRNLLASTLLTPTIISSVVPLRSIELLARRNSYIGREYAHLLPPSSAPYIHDSLSGLHARTLRPPRKDGQGTSKDAYHDLEMGPITETQSMERPPTRGARPASKGVIEDLGKKVNLGPKDGRGRKDSEGSGTSGNTADSNQPLLKGHQSSGDSSQPSLKGHQSSGDISQPPLKGHQSNAFDLPQQNLYVKTNDKETKPLGQKTPAFQTPSSASHNELPAEPDPFHYGSMYHTGTSWLQSPHNAETQPQDHDPQMPSNLNHNTMNPVYNGLRRTSSTGGSQSKSSSRRKLPIQRQPSTGKTGATPKSTPGFGNTLSGFGGGPPRMSAAGNFDRPSQLGPYGDHHHNNGQDTQGLNDGHNSPHHSDGHNSPLRGDGHNSPNRNGKRVKLPPKSYFEYGRNFIKDNAQQLTGFGFFTGNAVAAIGTAVKNPWVGAAGPAINAATSLGVMAIGSQNDARKKELRKALEADQLAQLNRSQHSTQQSTKQNTPRGTKQNTPQHSQHPHNQRRSLRPEARDLVHLLVSRAVKARTALDKRNELNKRQARDVRRRTVVF